MDLVTPNIGLVFWTTVSFLILLVILGKFAWPVISKAIATREQYISDSIRKADEANAKMESIKEERRVILAAAKEEQNNILKEVHALKEKLVLEAKTQAQLDANKIIEDARRTILQDKEKALKEIKNQVALISVGIAGKLLKKNLEGDKAQLEYVNTILDEIKVLNN